MIEPRVTVLMWFRDEVQFIADALRSIEEQQGGFAPGEVETIVVDDHSTDATVVVAGSFESVRMIGSEGVGVVDAANTGLRHARAPIVARLDADDVWVPGAFLTLVEALEDGPSLTLVGGSAMARRTDGMRFPLAPPLPTTEHVRVALMLESPFAHTAVAFRRDRVMALGGYAAQPNGETAGQDPDLFERILSAGDEVRGLPGLVVEVRVREGSVTSSRRDEQNRTAARVRRRASARWAADYSGFRRLVEVGRRSPRSVVAQERFQYIVLRLAVSAAATGDHRRALSMAAAAICLGPGSLIAGVVRAKRLHVMDRLGRGQPAWRRW